MPLTIKYKKEGKFTRGVVANKGEVSKKRDWPFLLEMYIQRNLSAEDGKTYTVRMLARDYGANYATMKDVAAAQKWGTKLDEARKERDKKVREKLTDHRANVIIKSQSSTANSEPVVRIQQANIARMARNKAAQRLKDLNPADLTVREAIELLRLGLVEERRALGIPDHFEVTHEEKRSTDYLSTSHARDVLGKVIELARNKSGTYVPQEG